jgi:hypothetical protein
MATIFLCLKLIWAAPWTLCGLLVGSLALATGGGVQRQGHVVEFWGGAGSWLLRRMPLAAGAAAMTLGHVVLAQRQADLAACRSHELVHVRQYERWGPLFLPAYLGWSVYLWYRGRNPYLDNPFEIEAYREGS